jgi:hypothetical protein
VNHTLYVPVRMSEAGVLTLAPLRIRQLRVDPLPFGPPGTRGTPRKRPAAQAYTPVTPAHTAAWAVTFRSAAGHHWLRSSPWPGRAHHGQPTPSAGPPGLDAALAPPLPSCQNPG